MKKLILLVLLPFFAASALAQNNESEDMFIDSTPDSIDYQDYNFFESEFKFNSKLFGKDKKHFLLYNAPTIGVFFGTSEAGYDNRRFIGKLADNGLISVNLGFTDINRFKNSPSVVEYDYSYFSVSNAKRDFMLEDDDAIGEIKTNQWRAGFSNADGYGWNYGDDVIFVLYHSQGIGWTALDVENKPAGSAIGIFGKQIRYGKQFSGGAKLYLFKHIAINAEYEKTMIFPRHMFWKDMLSSIIEGSAQGLAGWFAGKVANEAPIAAPIVHFVLKNAVSYGFYELYKDRMNWPVKTVAPFMNDNFKVGVNFTF